VLTGIYINKVNIYNTRSPNIKTRKRKKKIIIIIILAAMQGLY